LRRSRRAGTHKPRAPGGRLCAFSFARAARLPGPDSSSAPNRRAPRASLTPSSTARLPPAPHPCQSAGKTSIGRSQKENRPDLLRAVRLVTHHPHGVPSHRSS
jgi:hypothetical protein